MKKKHTIHVPLYATADGYKIAHVTFHYQDEAEKEKVFKSLERYGIVVGGVGSQISAIA